MTQSIPLFPLRTVLFPGGVLPLKIFEPRYLDMVSRCMRDGSGFGVVLMREEGSDARWSADDPQPEIFDLGTEARIVDFDELPGGMLGIVAVGDRKFWVRSTEERSDHLLMGEVEYLAEEPEFSLPAQFDGLAELLRELLEHELIKQLDLSVDLVDARAVSWRLAELLPLPPETKQGLLRLGHPLERLNELRRIIENLQASGGAAREG